MSSRDISRRLREAYRVVMKVALISLIGFSIESIFVLLSSSFILYADVVHWAIDGVLEFTVALSLYLASRVYRRFSWGILYFENLIVLLIASTIFIYYMYSFISYVNDAIISQNSITVTTTNPLLAIVSLIGAILTWISFQLLYRGYRRLGMELIKAEYMHALIDIIAALTTTAGIIATALTRSIAVELLTIIFILFFVFHSISDLFIDSFKSFLGLGVDPEIKYRILTVLNDFGEVDVKSIDVRRVGSFYIVRIECFINPSTTILRAHKLRLKIIEACREVSELMYHVDVIFYPYRKIRRAEKQNRTMAKTYS